MSLRSTETNRLISHVPGGGAPVSLNHEVARKGIENAMKALSHSKPALNAARHEAAKATDSFVSSVRNSFNNFTRNITSSIPGPRIP